MTILKITIEIPHLDASYVPVTTEILNANLEKLRTLIVYRESSIADLSPGFYLVRAVLPSGEISTAPVHITEDQTEASVSLKTSTSPHEWLAWQQFLGGYRRPSRISQAVNIDRWDDYDTPQDAWMRIWTFTGGHRDPSEDNLPYELQFGWQVEDIFRWYPLKYPNDDTPDLTAINLTFPVNDTIRQRVLQVGGEKLPWRIILLPPMSRIVSDIQVLLRPARSGVLLDRGVAIKLVTQDRETEVLSHYIHSGDYYNSAVLATELLDTAERLLREKLVNPYGALVGGYYLLGAGDLERLQSWPNNFANWVDWLPDSAVIHAWQILLDNDIKDKSMARTRLIEATYRGLPVFKQGLRYLVEGLQNFSSLAHQEHQEDNEVERALKFVQRFSRAANWNQRLVTYYGRSPYEPSLNPVIGMPDELPGVVEGKFSFTLQIAVGQSSDFDLFDQN